jgi:hypothetical protein
MTRAVNVSSFTPTNWTTATRPASPLTGQMGYNTTLNSPEYYDGSSWQSITTTGKAIAMSIVFGG